MELGFPEKLQRLDTPGATWSPRRSDQWGARVAPELTRPRFQPLISPRSGEPRPSQGSPFIENARLERDVRSMFLNIIVSLAGAVDAKDAYTHGHSMRVARTALVVGQALGLPRERMEPLLLLQHWLGRQSCQMLQPLWHQ